VMYVAFVEILDAERFQVAEITFKGHSRSSAMVWFDSYRVMPYLCFLVIMCFCCIISEIEIHT